ncbi:MAG: hypothetical protein AAGC93_10845 [Cyanobacteria bacterium P01_F01_bin.53]
MPSWPNAISNPFNGSLNSLATALDQAQSLIASAINHPVWAIVLLVVGIGLLQLIADLIKRLLKASLTLILKLPLLISQWIWKKATATPPTSENQVNQLITRLEALNQEHAQIVTELKALLSQSDMRPKKSLSKTPTLLSKTSTLKERLTKKPASVTKSIDTGNDTGSNTNSGNHATLPSQSKTDPT